MKAKYLLFVIAALITGCTGKETPYSEENSLESQPHDTIYTQQAAMAVYDYDPVRALQIIDSAVIVGNLSDWWADKNRARIYSQTRINDQFDSLMHWTAGARLDSAKAIGERLLRHDSIKNSLTGQQDVLEILAYTARQQQDTAMWLKRSRQLVEVCRLQGAETEALRNEAELGAALCCMGRQSEGMAMLDRVIEKLSSPTPSPSAGGVRGWGFNELDALVIALKRKIGVMTAAGQSEEILPLARRIIMLMDDYEQHPDLYHDGTYREPPADKRADYIRFYRLQAQNYIATAYAALGNTNDMNATFERLENIVREAETREHQARYRALEQQMQRQQAEALAERQQARANNIRLQSIAIFIIALLATGFAIVLFRKNRAIRQKNRSLVCQIDEVIKYKERYEQLRELVHAGAAAGTEASNSDLKPLSTEALFQHLCDDIREKHLYLDPLFDRQAVCDRYHLSAAQVGSAFAQGSDYDSVSDFIRDCRLEYACVLLKTTDMKIVDVVAASGFSRNTTFNHDFKARYNLTPSEYRRR